MSRNSRKATLTAKRLRRQSIQTDFGAKATPMGFYESGGVLAARLRSMSWCVCCGLFQIDIDYRRFGNPLRGCRHRYVGRPFGGGGEPDTTRQARAANGQERQGQVSHAP